MWCMSIWLAAYFLSRVSLGDCNFLNRGWTTNVNLDDVASADKDYFIDALVANMTVRDLGQSIRSRYDHSRGFC